MNFRKPFLAVALTLVCGSFNYAQAQTPTADMTAFQTAANNDFQSIASFLNTPFVNALGFFTGLGWNTTPTVYDLVSGPHFELGLGAGADFVPLPNLGSLNLPVVSASTNISGLPTGIPLPYPIVTARIGLFNGFDIGGRYTYLPPINAAGVGGNFTGWGVEARYKIFDGMALPTVTLSTSFDTMTGNLSFNTSGISQTGITYQGPSGTTYTNASLSGNTNYALNWVTRSVGAKVTVGKSLGILYPFAAIGFQRNSGTISSSITGNFAADLNDGNGPQSFTISGVSSGAPVVLEPKYVLGFNMGAGMGLEWSVVGESNGTDIAGTTAFAIQF